MGEDSDLDLMMQWLKDMLNWGVGDLKWKCGLAGLEMEKWEVCLVIVGSVFL